MLYDKLKIIERYNIHPDDARIIIDEKPVIDTLGDNKHALLMADINITDVTGINTNELKQAERVIYWKTDEDETVVNIIGIVWINAGETKLFKGEVLAP
jgi:hypothetical protein